MIKALKQFLQSLRFKWNRYKYREFAHPTKFDWRWGKKPFNRIAVVNRLIIEAGGWNTKYLEIGCNKNSLFHSVIAKQKVGVDPVRGGNKRMTSDQFFSQNPTGLFDVIFVDGLHEYQQVRRDVINALEHIPVGGLIGLHDLLPGTWESQHIPRITSKWNGDTWKISLELVKATGIEFAIVAVDEGVGVIRKVSNDVEIPDLNLAPNKYKTFVDHQSSLPIIEFEQLNSFLGHS
ncbi:MAG: class I SAM-dependent methyltransferase [Betaproteobacteria bacterium]